MTSIVASLSLAPVLWTVVLCAMSFLSIVSRNYASPIRCGPITIDGLEKGRLKDALISDKTRSLKNNTFDVPLTVRANGFRCGTNCCSHALELRSGDNDMQILEWLYKERSLHFLNDADLEPHSILVADSGSGLETALIASIFPTATVFCATEVLDRVVQRNTGIHPNVHGCTILVPCNIGDTSLGSSMSGIDSSVKQSRKAGVTSGPRQAGMQFEIVLLTAQTNLAVLKAAGLSDLKDLAHAGIVIVDSKAWQSTWHPRNIVQFRQHRRAFFKGWDIYMHAQGNPLGNSNHVLKTRQGTVKVFYHVAAKDHYRAVVLEHMSRLLFSGLYDRAEGIYCFILAESTASTTEAVRLLQSFGQKVHVMNTSTDISQFERFTLTGLRTHLAPEDVFLYMHTKGLRHNQANLNIHWWSLYMQYFLLRAHEHCINLLDRWDTVGVDWTEARPAEGVRQHYSGNFWWARADYYLRLEANIGSGYLDPEFHVGSGQAGRHFSLWQSQNNMYRTEYRPNSFTDSAPDMMPWLSMH